MTIPRSVAVFGLFLPWMLLVATLGWLFLKRFPLNGQFVVTTTFDDQNPFIHRPLPSERFVHGALVDDPVYINARIPGVYDRVEARLEFRPVGQPLLEFGVVRDAAGKQLDLHPLYSEQLEQNAWKRIDGGYVLNASSSQAFKDLPSDRLFTWKSQDERFDDLHAKRFTIETDVTGTETGGVLTPYERPRVLGEGWREGALVFAFRPNQDQLRFIVSAPTIRDRSGNVEFRRLTLVYKRNPLTMKNFKNIAVQELKNAYHRVRPALWN